MRYFILLICIFLHLNNFGQIIFTKKLFYNLPIDESKDKIIISIKADTSTFKVFDSDPSYPERIYAEAKQKSVFLPKTSYNPTFSTNDIKVYIDSVYKYSITELSIKFIYKSIFNQRRKAKRAYKILIKNMTGEFSNYIDYQGKPAFDYSVIKKRKFYLKSNADHKCTLEMVDVDRAGKWQIIVTWTL